MFEKDRRYRLMIAALEGRKKKAPTSSTSGFDLPSCFKAFLLIDSLGLSEDDINLLLATVGRDAEDLFEEEDVRRWVKKLFGREAKALKKKGGRAPAAPVHVTEGGDGAEGGEGDAGPTTTPPPGDIL